MPDALRVDKAFAKLLRHHAYGWALYKKVTAADMHPGSCGYFDAEGDWQTLVDLTRPPNDLLLDGWKAPSTQIHPHEAPESLVWYPKTSRAVKTKQLGGTVGATTAFTPVEASVTSSFESATEQGAVLATESPVRRYRIGDEAAALQWMTDNAPAMLQRHKAVVKRHGVWIITKTYTARRCAVAVMSGKSSAVAIGLGASVPGLVTVTPTSSWTTVQGDCSTEVHEDEEGVVVFMSGIYFRGQLLSSKLKSAQDQSEQKDRIFRGGFVESDDEANSGDELELELEMQNPDVQNFE